MLSNLFVQFIKVRLATNVSDDVEDDPTGNKALWDRGLLSGASQKAEIVSNFHIGEVCTSLQASLHYIGLLL